MIQVLFIDHNRRQIIDHIIDETLSWSLPHLQVATFVLVVLDRLEQGLEISGAKALEKSTMQPQNTNQIVKRNVSASVVMFRKNPA